MEEVGKIALVEVERVVELFGLEICVHDLELALEASPFVAGNVVSERTLGVVEIVFKDLSDHFIIARQGVVIDRAQANVADDRMHIEAVRQGASTNEAAISQVGQRGYEIVLGLDRSVAQSKHVVKNRISRRLPEQRDDLEDLSRQLAEAEHRMRQDMRVPLQQREIGPRG